MADRNDHPDRASLRDAVTTPSTWASVAVSAPSAVADADQRLDILLDDLARDLGQRDLDDNAVQRLVDELGAFGHDEGRSLLGWLDAASGRVLTAPIGVVLERPLARVDTLPSLGHYLEWRQTLIPHVVVTADRAGADIIESADGRTLDATTVEGDTDVIHRGSAGGWSQRRFQQRAENQWDDNAAEVARAVTESVERTGARIIVAAGDVRALGMLRDHLSPDDAALLHEIPGGRADGVDEDAMVDDIDTALADVGARDVRDLLGRHAAAAPSGQAVAGPADTLEMLGQGRASHLLVHDDPDDDRRAAFLIDGPVSALDTAALEGLGSDPAEGRLVDVAIRAALLTGAEIVIVPPTLDGAIGALLR